MTQLDWNKNRDSETGLWWYETAEHMDSRLLCPDRVRRGAGAAAMLLVATQAGELDAVDLSKVLEGLRKTQILDGGANHGEFLQYLGEECISDVHSTFFTGLALCGFYGAYGEQLNNSNKQQLNELLADMRVAVLRHVREEHFYYPNEYLGDAVCAWLAGELLGDDTEKDYVAK